MSDQTVLHLLHRNGRTNPHDPAYYEKVNGQWKATNWSNYLAQVRQAARALLALGLDKGDIITILGFNRSEWVVMDLAGILIGGAAAGIYTSNSPSEVQYIIDHAEAKIVLVEDYAQWQKLDAERENLPFLQYIVLMKGAKMPDDPMAMSWEDFLKQGDEVAEDELDKRLDSLQLDQLATLIYTSGTTGPPKAVMLSHENLIWTAVTAARIISADSNDSCLSYLPLSHIAEQMFSVHVPITARYPIYFAESVTKIADNLKEIQPTIIFGVPRVWERFYNGVSARLGEATGVKATLAGWSRGVATKVTALRNQGKEPAGLLALQYNVAHKLVLGKVHNAIGLGNARMCISGAAPIPRHILEFFGTLDISIKEVYGQSEGTGPTTFNQTGNIKFGSVGSHIPGIDVKIADDGEILAKGPNIFLGYYKNESATNATLIDGWLYSGDLGKFDETGHLQITGRKKDIIITSGGKNIAPKNIEAALTTVDLISSAVVIGEQQRYLIALLTLDPDAAQRFATEQGLPLAGLHENAALREAVQAEIKEKVNTHFARVEQLRNFVILENDFSVEGGELTPTFKIKRSVVSRMYADAITTTYEAGQIL